MNQVRLTQFFRFSASFAHQKKIYGHNYKLGITTSWMDDESEKEFVRRIEEKLISQIHSRDLTLDVPFLKGLEITDAVLLEHFYVIALKAAEPQRIYSMALERNSRTTATFLPDTL